MRYDIILRRNKIEPNLILVPHFYKYFMIFDYFKIKFDYFKIKV